MRSATELCYSTLTELCDSLRTRQVSAPEVVQAYLARIEAIDPHLNAYVEVLAERALQAAQASSRRLVRGEGGRLEGVPIPIKDNVAVQGAGLRCGSAMIAWQPAAQDAVLVQRLREAGAIIIGKTNLPEFGTIPSTERGVHGDAHNPWDRSRTPGGSSGGAAAALAAGLAPAAHGNDGGGSLRIPASCCGVYSIKPTRARISRAPQVEAGGGLVVDGFLTRSVADQALLLDICSGPAPGDLCSAAPPPRPFAAALDGVGPALRIAWTVTPPLEVPVCDSAAAAVRETAALCEALGHRVDEETPPWRSDTLMTDFIACWAAAIGADLDHLTDMGGDPALANAHNRALHALQQEFSPARLLVIMGRLQAFARQVMQFWNTYDVVLSPVLTELPLHLGELFEHEADDPLSPVRRAGSWCAFTPLVNVTGQPAASLPMHWTAQGLPVGVQAIGGTGEEATLLRLSAQLEAALPWAHRHPPLPG